MKNLIISIFIFLLSACATHTERSSANLNIPSEVFYSCPNLPIAKSSLDTDLLNQSAETFKLYQECRKWNEEKNKILKQLTK
jgi:hypothetical protein